MRRLAALLLPLVVPPWSAGAEEEVIPTRFPVSRYTATWDDSPFTREVVKPTVQTVQSDFARNLTLEGLVNDDEAGPIAYVRDLQADQSLVITSETHASHPYTLVSANQVNDPQQTTVTVTNGNEEAEIGYEAGSMTRAIDSPRPSKTSSTAKSGSAADSSPRSGPERAEGPEGAVDTAPPGARGPSPSTSANDGAARAAQTPSKPTSEPSRRRRVLLPRSSED